MTCGLSMSTLFLHDTTNGQDSLDLPSNRASAQEERHLQFRPVPPLHQENGVTAPPRRATGAGLSRLVDDSRLAGNADRPGASIASTPTSIQDYARSADASSVHEARRMLAPISGTADSPTSYQLRELGFEEFESRLWEIWGDRISAELLDEDRTLRITIPSGLPGKTMPMVFDRLRRVLTFEGPADLLGGWKRTVGLIDRSAASQATTAVELIAAGPTEADTLRQVVYRMAVQDDQENPTVRRELQLPPGSSELALPGIQRQEDLQNILNKVRIEVIPESGLIVLVGDPADVAIVEEMIKKIVEATETTAPSIMAIPLTNQKSEDIVDAIQSLYDSGFADRLGPATITAISTPNRLLVVGKKESLRTIEELVRALDVEAEQAPEGEFQTFHLKYISASDAKQRVDEYFGQAQQATLLEPPSPAPVYTVADYRSNTLVVKASPAYLKQVAELLQDLDVDDSQAKNVIRIFPVRNVLAQDLQVVLQDAINGQLQNAGQGYNPDQGALQNQQNQGGLQQNQPNSSQLRSPSLELWTLDENGRRINGGIMFDVRITTSANDNSLVVTGPENAMDLIEALIEQLDRVPDAETQIKVFTVMNGDAQSLLDMLQTLFGTNAQQGGGAGANQAGQSLQTLPLQSASAEAGNSLVNLRFSVDLRTNSIIASGPVGDLRVVEDLLTRLDVSDLQDRRISVYRLSNAPVLDVSDAINNYLQERADITSAIVPTQLSPRREVIVVPEAVSNSLIVSARPEDFVQIEAIIRALDRRPPMVKVKVLIAEVNLDRLEEFGVDVGIQDSLIFNGGFSNSVGTGFIGLNNLAGQALSNLGVGRSNSNLGYGGFVLSAGNESINLLLRALKDKQCARILSKPHIMTIENLQGRVQIGAQVPFITQVNQTNFGLSNTVEFRDVGVILEITPRVSPDGMIVMFVDATNSSLGAEDSGTPIFINDNGDIIRSPAINTTTAQTAIMARSGQTVVFSGLLQESKSHGERGMPILSDLPVVGPLFKFETDSVSRRELLIVLTPYLVDEEQDLELLNQSEMNRMHWCLSDVNEIYGDLSSTDGYFVDGTQVFYPDQDPAGENPAAPSVAGSTARTNQAQPQSPNPGFDPAASAQSRVMPASSPTTTKSPASADGHQGSAGRDTAVPLGTYYGPATAPGKN